MRINIITKRIILDFSFPEHIIPKGLVFAYTDNNIVTYWQVKWISGWAILGSKWKCCPQSSEAGKNQQAWGFDWVWQRTNYGKWEINKFFVFSVSTPAELYTTCLIPPFTQALYKQDDRCIREQLGFRILLSGFRLSRHQQITKLTADPLMRSHQMICWLAEFSGEQLIDKLVVI